MLSPASRMSGPITGGSRFGSRLGTGRVTEVVEAVSSRTRRLIPGDPPRGTSHLLRRTLWRSTVAKSHRRIPGEREGGALLQAAMLRKLLAALQHVLQPLAPPVLARPRRRDEAPTFAPLKSRRYWESRATGKKHASSDHSSGQRSVVGASVQSRREQPLKEREKARTSYAASVRRGA
jgi:hypothetical protein